MEVLTSGDAKTSKGEILGYFTGIQYLDPTFSDKVCPLRSSFGPDGKFGCSEPCLFVSGRSEFIPMINLARRRKTAEFFANKTAYVEKIERDVKRVQKRAKHRKMTPCVRLNGTSDILWELFGIFGRHTDVQFYDYTKILARLKRHQKASNYHLTFSYSGENAAECLEALEMGYNVAVVFHKDIPSTFANRDVIDGTTHDLRFLDGYQGKIIGLRAKGKKAKASARAGNPFFVNEKTRTTF